MANKLTEREGVGRVDGARTPEVAALMQRAVDTGKCPFCSPSFEETNGKQLIWSQKDWNVWHNPSAFAGTKHHIMLAPKRHVLDITELTKDEFSMIQDLVAWLQERFEIVSYSLLSRSGDRRYNSATVEHLHVHIIVSDGEEVTLEDFTEHEIELMRSVEMLLPHREDILEELDDLRELIDRFRAMRQGGKAVPIRAKLSNKAQE